MNNSNNYTQDNNFNNIPKEIINQYPYGDFPIKYTKSGQEKIRIQSEHRYENYIENATPIESQNNSTNIDTILPLIQILTKKQKSPNDMMEIMSKILFKDNPKMEKIFTLFNNNIKKQNIDNTSTFPDTNKYDIDKLKRVDGKSTL